MEEMADFYIDFAHAAIDAAPTWWRVTAAPHARRRGLSRAPILYSLGNFIFQKRYRRGLSVEAYQTLRPPA